jgi:hypothetical protein
VSKNTPRERAIEEKVNTYAKEQGFLVYKFTSPQRAAVCDRIWICNGQVRFVEFKREGMKPTPAQHRHHQLLAKHGVTVYVIDNIALGKEIIDHEAQQKAPGHHWSAVRYIGSDST